jgi:hypothetical protein
MNTYGGGNPTLHNQGLFSGSSPGPPFHVASSVSLEAQQSYPFGARQPEVPNPQDVPAEAGARQESTATAMETTGNEADMDTSPDGQDHPTPSTLNSQSRGASTSHTSYSPSRSFEDPKPLQYRPSPKAAGSMSQSQTAFSHTTTPNSTTNYFTSTTQDPFGTNFFGGSVPPPQTGPSNDGFLMNNDWDMPTCLGTNTGMTPLPEGTWNQMLESINMGWDSLGPPRSQPG